MRSYPIFNLLCLFNISKERCRFSVLMLFTISKPLKSKTPFSGVLLLSKISFQSSYNLSFQSPRKRNKKMEEKVLLLSNIWFHSPIENADWKTNRKSFQFLHINSARNFTDLLFEILTLKFDFNIKFATYCYFEI